MASPSSSPEQNKARPVSSVKGKPIIVIEQFLNPERTPSTSTSSSPPSTASGASPPQGRPKIEIEQFLNPERRPTSSSFSSSQRTHSFGSSKEDPFTPSWYYQMTQEFRDAHPLAPGGGMLAPPRSNAPIVEESPKFSELSINERQSKPTQRFRTRSFFESKPPPKTRDQRSASVPNRFHRTSPRFQSTRSPSSSGSRGQQRSPSVGSTSLRTKSPKRYRDRTFYGSSPGTPQTIDPNDQFTPPWYYQMPKEFRDAHPLAPGGGMIAPPRCNAPLLTNEMIMSGSSGTTSGKSRNRRRRRGKSGRNKRHFSDQSRVWVPKDRIVYNRNSKQNSRRNQFRGQSGQTSSTRNRRNKNLTPDWYQRMPQEFRDGHPLASGGGLLSPGRSYAPPPPDYTGPNIERIMRDKNMERLRQHTQS